MVKNTFKFQQQHDEAKRENEAARIRSKYPDRIPVIVERDQDTDIPEIDKVKYLVPADLSMGQFQYVIRKRIKLNPEKSLFFFLESGTIPAGSTVLSQIDMENRNKDGFLYMRYTGENTFG